MYLLRLVSTGVEAPFLIAELCLGTPSHVSPIHIFEERKPLEMTNFRRATDRSMVLTKHQFPTSVFSPPFERDEIVVANLRARADADVDRKYKVIASYEPKTKLWCEPRKNTQSRQLSGIRYQGRKRQLPRPQQAHLQRRGRRSHLICRATFFISPT